MKIVIIGPSYPYRGGIALFNERLAKAFLDDKHQVEIITFKLQYPTIFFPGKTQYSEDISPKNIQIKRLINSVNPINWIKVGIRLKKQNPDLVIFSYWMPFMAPCFGIIASFLTKSKKIGLIHNIIPHEKRLGDRFLTKFYVKRNDAFIVMSKGVNKDLLTFTSKPTVITPHPLYDNFGDAIPKIDALKSLNLDSNYRYLLFFGIIRKYKGLDILLQAFTNEKLKGIKLKLIVAGEFYEDDSEYLKIIEDNDLKDDVILTKSFIPNSDVSKYFCACDMVVQPYRTATQSGVTQIAYHFNKPMLVTEVGGLKEMVPNNVVGYVTKPTPQGVADAIEDFYSNAKEAFFIQGIIQEKQKFSWNNMIEAIINLQQKIL